MPAAIALTAWPARVEQLKGQAAPACAGDGKSHRGRTALPRLHHHAARRNDDQPPHRGFCRPQHAEHGAVERTGQPLDGIRSGEPDHGEEGGNDAPQRFAIAFNGHGPVHAASKNKKRTMSSGAG